MCGRCIYGMTAQLMCCHRRQQMCLQTVRLINLPEGGRNDGGMCARERGGSFKSSAAERATICCGC